MSNEKDIQQAYCQINMLKDLGFELKPGMKILDFGCGNGVQVKVYSELGYDAYGVDIIDCPLLDEAHYAKIGFDPYRLPFDDNTFDLVFSNSVFEHTQNTEECFREVHRVLKLGGATINCMPSRYRLREAHMFVPLGGLIQFSFWYKLWALLGIRNSFQTGLGWKETAARNIGYAHNELNYHSYRKLKKMIIDVFGNVKIVKKEYINNMQGGAARLGRKLPIPGYGSLIFFFREWLLYMVKE